MPRLENPSAVSSGGGGEVAATARSTRVFRSSHQSIPASVDTPVQWNGVTRDDLGVAGALPASEIVLPEAAEYTIIALGFFTSASGGNHRLVSIQYSADGGATWGIVGQGGTGGVAHNSGGGTRGPATAAIKAEAGDRIRVMAYQDSSGGALNFEGAAAGFGSALTIVKHEVSAVTIASPLDDPWTAGIWHAPPFPNGSHVAAAWGRGGIAAVPLKLDVRGSGKMLDRIACEVVGATAGAGNVWMGVYADGGGYPTNLLDAIDAAIAGTSGGIKEGTISCDIGDRRMIWLAYLATGGTADPSVRRFANFPLPGGGASAATEFFDPTAPYAGGGWHTNGGGHTSLPATFPMAGAVSYTGLPILAVRSA